MPANTPDRRARNLATGRARFIDDAMPARRMLETALVESPYARAGVVSIDASDALAVPGVHAVLTADDIAGVNNLSPEGGTMPLLAGDSVSYHHQPVAVVVAEDSATARKAAELVKTEYQPRPPVLGVEEAVALQSFHGDAQELHRGDSGIDQSLYPGAFAKMLLVPGQEHFALETGVAWAETGEEGELKLTASAEDLGFVRRGVASLLGMPMSQVKVSCPRIGGSFGGKLTGALIPAGVAALAAQATELPVRVRLDRDDEFRLTGKQNATYAEFHAAYDETGLIGLLDCTVYLDGGWAIDRAESVLRSILHHLDSAYYIPNIRLAGRICRTNLPPSTTTLSEGTAVAAMIAEEVIAEISARLDVLPEAVRTRNLYGAAPERSLTPYGQDVSDLRLGDTWRGLLDTAAFSARRSEIDSWNATSRFAKRGFAAVPVKIGCGALESEARQASATVALLADGSAQVVCGEVEVGGAMRRTIAAYMKDQLGIDGETLQIVAGETDRVAASHHGELHAEAVLAACRQLRERLCLVAAKLLEETGVEITDLMELVFSGGAVADVASPDAPVALGRVVQAAIASDVNVTATGYSSAAEILGGRTFRDFACGAAAAEVLVDGFTGEVTVLRADVLMDVGRQLEAEAEIGQIRGAFTQGLGWLTCEDLLWSSDGELATASADSYLIPTAGEVPLQFRVELMPSYGGYPKEPGAAGYTLALSVREAIRDAVRGFGKVKPGFVLPSPSTPEAVYFALHARDS